MRDEHVLLLVLVSETGYPLIAIVDHNKNNLNSKMSGYAYLQSNPIVVVVLITVWSGLVLVGRRGFREQIGNATVRMKEGTPVPLAWIEIVFYR